MFLRTLGGLELSDSGFRQLKPLLLLAYLTVEGPKDRRYLAELFWPTAADHMNSLRKALSLLRRVENDIVPTDTGKMMVEIPSDVSKLNEHLDSGDHEAAVALYRAPFLENLYVRACGEELGEWIHATRDYFAERVQAAALGLAEQALKQRKLDQATQYAERAFSTFPEAEPETLKRLYHVLSAGESVVAKQVRQEAQSYGLLLPDPKRVSVTAESTTPSNLNNLPTRATSYIGREWELVELSAMLTHETCRLVTVIGMGGVGKTRLALQVAKLQAASFRDGVYFVALEAVSNAGRVPEKIAEALGLELKGRESALEQISQHLADKCVLLVLDNFEHLVAGSSIISDLLLACPELSYLVTSRETLHLEEEWLFDLQGMLYPGTSNLGAEQMLSYDAVRLFVERAAKAQRRFERSRENLTQVVALCKLVQGSPLALEMAASWTRIMPVGEIVKELSQSVKGLSSQTRDAPERHRSIKATFDYSWYLLSASEQAALAGLAVFRGGFRREAAQRVVDITVPILMTLLDKSLLQRVGAARYDLHPLIQAFSLEKLKEREDAVAVYERHADYYLSLAKEARSSMRNNDQARWLGRLDEEHDNLLAVLDWTQEKQIPMTGLELAVILSWLWATRGYFQLGRARLRALRQRLPPDEHPALRIEAIHDEGTLAFWQGNYDEAKALYEEGLASSRDLGDQRAVARALDNLGVVANHQGDYAKARELLEESLSINRALGDQHPVARSLNSMGSVMSNLGDYEKAKRFYEESLAIKRAIGDQKGTASSLNNLGNIAKNRGDYDEARMWYEESLKIKRALGNQLGLAISLNNLGNVAHYQGNYGEAKRFYGECLTLSREIGDQEGIAYALADIARLFIDLKLFEDGVKLLSASEAVCERIGGSLKPQTMREVQQGIEQAREVLEKVRFAQLWQAGKNLSANEAVDLALAKLSSVTA